MLATEDKGGISLSPSNSCIFFFFFRVWDKMYAGGKDFLWRQETALRIAGKGVGRESAAALFFLGNWELVSNSSLLSTDAPGRIDGKVTSCREEGFAHTKTK